MDQLLDIHSSIGELKDVDMPMVVLVMVKSLSGLHLLMLSKQQMMIQQLVAVAAQHRIFLKLLMLTQALQLLLLQMTPSSLLVGQVSLLQLVVTL